ncbi:MAG: heavy-metal-associated domain-containing protein [Saprospiraceae bacterium]
MIGQTPLTSRASYVSRLSRLLIALSLALIAVASAQAQTPVRKKAAATTLTLQADTFAVLGNCGMCKARIEGAARSAAAADAQWNAKDQLLIVRYEPSHTSLDAIQRAVAGAGHDNAGYRAPDKVYESLHSCCFYDRGAAPEQAKSLEKSDH